MTPLYAVIEFDQASEPDDQMVTFFDEVTDAHEHAHDLRRDSGRYETYRVFELVEVKS